MMLVQWLYAVAYNSNTSLNYMQPKKTGWKMVGCIVGARRLWKYASIFDATKICIANKLFMSRTGTIKTKLMVR